MYRNYQDFHFDKNKLIKNNNTQYFILGFIILILLIINIAQKNAYDNLYIKNYQDDIKNRSITNKLLNDNEVISAELETQKQLYNYLDSINIDLLQKIRKQEIILTDLKTKYEKANKYSRNYNADSIRIYFANIEE
jgi:hypothetical protein